MNEKRRLNLRRLLKPRSVALVGGRTLAPSVEMLRRAGFEGRIDIVNPSHAEIAGIACVPTIDDLPEAPYFTPPLTTVRQDFAELGRRGVQLVLARLRGEELHPRPVPPQLIVRASTGPARER